MRWIPAALPLLVGAIVACATPTTTRAQDATGSDLINLFFDCQAPSCFDPDFFRREAPFVNWVVDRQVADVHVLVTSQSTGGGGRVFTLAFIGLRQFDGENQELTHTSSGDATNDEQRSGISEKLKLGLVRYVQGTSAGDRLRVTLVTPPGAGSGGEGGGGAGATAADDPWDFWVFTLAGNAFLNGQATYKSSDYYGSLRASRTTEAWKLSVSGNYSRSVQDFDIPASDGSVSVVSETREDWGTQGLVVRSLGPRWAVGFRADVGRSTRFNQDLRWSAKPGIEFNIFPYEESSRRSLTLQYLAGPIYYDYTEPTIFLKNYEATGQHSLTARISLVQPWGRWSTSLTGQQFLHDASKYSVTLNGNFNIRLFRGFSIRLGGNYQWVRDQVYLAAAGATEEQILLRQRDLATSYRYFTSFGFEYTFGSIFNNVVNPRFGSSGGEIFFF